MIIEFHITIYKKRESYKKYISWIIYKILPKRKIKKQKQKSILKKDNHYMVFVQSQVWIELGGDKGFISTDSLNSWLSRVFVFLSFSDETHSDRNYNDQSKTKTENSENNYTEWIFGIHTIWSSADSNCWVVRSPCEH